MSPSESPATSRPALIDAPASSPTTVVNPAAAATRSLGRLDTAQPPLLLSAPASQESHLSVQSAQSSVGSKLETSSSNASQWTNHTDLTSPTIGMSNGRLHTPEPAPLHSNTASQNGPVPHSPSLAYPSMTNGAKRTASGSVKNTTPSLPNTPLTSAFPGRKPRADSMSSTGSRAGDLALSLKTRLEYAMAKVQHGWEHKNIHEVERLARHRTSPDYRHSMSHLDYARRPTTMVNGAAHTMRLSDYEPNGHYLYEGKPAVPPSKRHSGTYGSYASTSQPTFSTVPRLQPAADIRPSSNSQPQQQSYHRLHPAASPNGFGNGSIMSPPRTPVHGPSRGRPSTIRTELQTAEAEREALQALFQLGSPHGSHTNTFHHTSQLSSSQGSPLGSEFATPRKVTFARSESDSSADRVSTDGRRGEEATQQMVEV